MQRGSALNKIPIYGLFLIGYPVALQKGLEQRTAQDARYRGIETRTCRNNRYLELSLVGGKTFWWWGRNTKCPVLLCLDIQSFARDEEPEATQTPKTYGGGLMATSCHRNNRVGNRQIRTSLHCLPRDHQNLGPHNGLGERLSQASSAPKAGLGSFALHRADRSLP